MSPRLLPLLCRCWPWSPVAAAADRRFGFGGGDFDRAAPVEVSADNLTIDQDTGRAVLTGNVVIAQDQLRLSADTVVVDYSETEGDRKIDVMDAQGNVIIVAGEDAAEGETALYTVATTDIVMTGDVVITQGQNIARGRPRADQPRQRRRAR